MKTEESIVKAFEKADFSKESSLQERLREKLFGGGAGKHPFSSLRELSLDDLSMVSAAGDIYTDKRPRKSGDPGKDPINH